MAEYEKEDLRELPAKMSEKMKADKDYYFNRDISDC